MMRRKPMAANPLPSSTNPVGSGTAEVGVCEHTPFSILWRNAAPLATPCPSHFPAKTGGVIAAKTKSINNGFNDLPILLSIVFVL
jgi:hypothetical protein